MPSPIAHPESAENVATMPPASATVRPPATTFLVIRHAESVANAGGYFGSQSDSPLTELGWTQARALAMALQHASINAIYSSDLSRARCTVELLASHHGRVIHETPLLRERDMGELTGKSFDEARATLPELWARLVARDPTAKPPGGETQADLGARVERFLSGLLERHLGQVVVIASHGGTIHHLIRQLVGVHDLGIPMWLSVANASISRIDVIEPSHGVYARRLTYVNRIVPFGDEPMLP